jgi:hypothetical protein
MRIEHLLSKLAAIEAGHIPKILLTKYFPAASAQVIPGGNDWPSLL